MTPFSHWFPRQRVLSGRGIAARVLTPALDSGVSRPLIVCSRRAAADPLVGELVSSLPPGAARVYGGVEPHAPLHAAIEGARCARAHGADGVVALGGGSASDLAKGIALALAEGDDLGPFVLRRERGVVVGRQSTAPKVPVVALPTTLSGAEITPGFSLTQSDGYKLLFRDPALAASLIVLDPSLLEGVPPAVLAGSGMNALAHCFEALYSRARTPISDVLAEEGLRRLWLGMQERVGGGDGAEDLLVGAYLAGSAIVNARTALHHAICHKLAPMAGLSHGEANALVLPHALAYNLPHCPQETARMARVLQLPDEPDAARPGTIVARIGELVGRAGLPSQLRDTQFARERIPELARRVHAEPGLVFNPRPIEDPDVIATLLEGAW